MLQVLSTINAALALLIIQAIVLVSINILNSRMTNKARMSEVDRDNIESLKLRVEQLEDQSILDAKKIATGEAEIASLKTKLSEAEAKIIELVMDRKRRRGDRTIDERKPVIEGRTLTSNGAV